MAIFIQCPLCRRKQKSTHKKCVECKEDLVKAKKNNRIRYWISSYIGKVKMWRSVGFNLSEAKSEEVKLKDSPHSAVRKILFEDLARLYLASSVKKKKYYHTVKIRLKKFGLILGQKQIFKISLADLENLQNSRLDSGWAPATIDQEISAVKTMLQWGIDHEYIDPNCLKPFRKAKKLLKHHSNERNKTLSVSEFYHLLDNCDQSIKPIVALGYLCGMRLGEILGLTWDKVDISGKQPQILLEAKDTKEKKSKLIPLPGFVKDNPVSLIRNIPRQLHSQKLFMQSHSFRLLFKEACLKAGITYGRFQRNGLIFHDLRHCFVTNMRRAGVDLLTIMLITGHSRPRELAMSSRYSQFSVDDLFIAMSKMEIFISESLQKESISSSELFKS